MAFRLPSQKKFKPSNKVVARKASIPASLAKQPSSSAPGPSKTPVSGSSQLPSDENGEESSTQDAGIPPSIDAVPTIGSSQPASTSATLTQPSPVFREPSLPPPSRKRAASPTPSNASKSSRTGGRPTMIHVAASSGPARRPTASPSPAPQTASMSGDHDATGHPVVPSPSSAPPTSLPRVSPSLQRNTPTPKLSAPRQLPRVTASPAAPSAPAPTPPVQTTTLPSNARASASVTPASPVRAPSEPFGMPPMIGQSIIDPVLLNQTPGAGPSREETAKLARALVDGIAAQPAPPKKKRLTKMGTVRKKPGPPKGRPLRNPDAPPRPRRKKKGSSAASGSADPPTDGGGDGNTAEGEQADGDGNGETAAKKKRTNRRKPPELDEDGNPIRKPRPPYGSKGLAKTDKDGRLRHNREAKLAREAGFPDDDEVDEFAEDIPVDPGQQIMGSFARGYYDGDMTERARKLKDAQKQKREEALREKLEFEQYKRIRLQPLRRRERAKRNEARALRRVASEAAGAEGEEVSEDEVDSTDEEYEFEPDRLTPPGTPEPENYDEQGGDEGQEGGLPNEDEEEGLGDVTAHPDDQDEEVDPDEDDEPRQDVDLGDFGFNVGGDGEEAEVGDDQPRDPNEADPDVSALFNINPDEAELEFDDDGRPTFSFADYSANMEARRAAALANTNSRFVYTEDDDETRMVNSSSWAKREKTDKWTDDETDFFYSVLGEVGENYGLMKAFFPGRSIAQIKRKGLRENAKNPEKVTQAILSRRPIDNHYLQKSAGYDPDRPWDAEEALFAEAKRDMEKLKAEDRGEEYLEDNIGEPDFGDDHGHAGDETFDADEQEVGGEEEAGEEPEAGVVEGEEATGADNQGQVEGDGALFLPGGEDEHGSP